MGEFNWEERLKAEYAELKRRSAFAAKMCGLPISQEAKRLLDKYIEKRRKE